MQEVRELRVGFVLKGSESAARKFESIIEDPDEIMTIPAQPEPCVGREVVIDGDVFDIARLTYTNEQVKGRYQTIDLKATAFRVHQSPES